LTELEVFEHSLKNKDKLYQFYFENLKRMNHPLSREIFKRIADDESFYVRKIQEGLEQIRKGEHFSSEFRESLRKSSREYFDSIFFETFKNQNHKEVVEVDEVEIVDAAMKMETDMHHFLIQKGKEIEETKIREFLSFLASEDYRHFNLLFNTKEFLINPNGWSLPRNGKVSQS